MPTKYRRADCRVGLLLAAGMLATLTHAEDEASAAGPRAVVETLHEALADATPRTLETRYEFLYPVVASTHDLPYIAELTIRRQWPELGPAERERFVTAFERLSVTTYASRFQALGPDSLRILSVSDTSAPRVQVDAEIVRHEDRNIPLEYTLEDRGDGWRIINIFADGVSDLALRRAEYQRVLADGTIADLIERLEEQTASLRAK